MRRPVWLFSMNTDHFLAPPMTTGALKAFYVAHGRTASSTQVELVHFLRADDIERWMAEEWPHVRAQSEAALEAGLQPVFGFSCYTWNVAEFLDMIRTISATEPRALVTAGGPHVQRGEDFLYDDGIDVIVLGEGEETFTELLDAGSRAEWPSIRGLTFLSEDGSVQRTETRPRSTQLDQFPSALDVIALRDEDGKPLYKQAAYETSRGCPYRCSFCEWGTGAIGTKMYQFSLERIRRDCEQLIAGGIEDIWLCDSNFGALREDLEKAQIIVELRERTGFPNSFATSWSKNHNKRVHEIVRLMHKHGLLYHYHLALQTLTPKALELSHRTNMRANDYEPIVKVLAAEGVPVAAELIWPLPGDNLADFERNLDHILTVFPNVNIFGYTLLPGTEFHDRREELELVTIPVAGYGKAKGEYVVGCQTFDRNEGEEGYLLIAAYIMLVRGYILPLTARFLALGKKVPVTPLLRQIIRHLAYEFAAEMPAFDPSDRMATYERRAELYVHCLSHPDRTNRVTRETLQAWLETHAEPELARQAMRVLALDQCFAPRTGASHEIARRFDFAADQVEKSLRGMELPVPELLEPGESVELTIHHRAGAGEMLIDPDGGMWMGGTLKSVRPVRTAAARTTETESVSIDPSIHPR
jgi:hypothetical protein